MLKKIARWLLKDEINEIIRNAVDLALSKKDADDIRKSRGVKLDFGFENEAKKLCEELKQKIANVKPEITIIDPFPIDDPQYLGKLAEIVRSSEFLFHIYTIKQNLMEKLVTGDENVAVSLQNQLKGIDYLFSSMVRAGRAYVQMMDAHKENMQGAKDE